MKNKNSKRGFARWKGIPKKARSAEMSRIAKIRAVKYNSYKKIAEQTEANAKLFRHKLTTPA